MPPRGARVLLLTCVALTGFAANSLLCRKALGVRSIDAASFTTLRLGSGAAALAGLCWLSRKPLPRSAGSWGSAFALFAYAILFSIAYLKIGAGVGALVLFGAVQTTMIGWALVRGERPTRLEWIGLSIALLGLAVLTIRGFDESAPDPGGLALMAAAGAAWGVYTIHGKGRGRGATSPLQATAGNFARTVPLALGASVLAFALTDLRLSTSGALLAVVSGAVASGLCYSVWYAALPGLSATRAAVVQLCVPVLAALGAVLFLGEPITLRLVVSAAAILGGIALVVLGKSRPR